MTDKPKMTLKELHHIVFDKFFKEEFLRQLTRTTELDKLVTRIVQEAEDEET